MSRLVHNINAHFKSLQISRNNLFIIIEGKTHDPYFYNEICHIVCKNKIRFVIIKSQEIKAKAPGKTGLLEYYKYLLKKKKLSSTYKRKKMSIVFFADKDIDDILLIKCKTNHLIYTKYYNIENHLFINGDLIQAIASTASLPRDIIERWITDVNLFLKNTAELWKEWLILCILTKKIGINCEHNYGSHSRIHCKKTGALNKKEYTKYLKKIEKSSKLTSTNFKARLNRIIKLVNSYYNNNNQDLIFKGNWYTSLIKLQLDNQFGIKNYYNNGFEKRLETALLSRMEFNEDWTKDFILPFQKIISWL